MAPYKRANDTLEAFVIHMLEKSVTTAEIAHLMERMYGHNYTPQTISNMTKVMSEQVEATAFPSSSHAHISEVSIGGNLTGRENEDLFGTLTGWETSGNSFETEQLDLFVFEEAVPVEFSPIKQEEDTRSLFLVGA